MVRRWRSEIVTLSGSECAWWTGAVSGRGHGRFYYAPGRVVIAHRFAFGRVNGVNVFREVPGVGASVR